MCVCVCVSVPLLSHFLSLCLSLSSRSCLSVFIPPFRHHPPSYPTDTPNTHFKSGTTHTITTTTTTYKPIKRLSSTHPTSIHYSLSHSKPTHPSPHPSKPQKPKKKKRRRRKRNLRVHPCITYIHSLPRRPICVVMMVVERGHRFIGRTTVVGLKGRPLSSSSSSSRIAFSWCWTPERISLVVVFFWCCASGHTTLEE